MTDKGELDIDRILAIIGNSTRRQILRKLAKETHYPLQLSRELNVSQQAIMKHLKVLEESDLVRSVFQKSDSGPPRRYYAATKKITLVIDLSPEMFHEELRVHDPAGDVIEAGADSEALSNADNLRARLLDFMETITSMNRQLEELARERERLLEMKGRALKHTNRIIDIICKDYDQRKILRYLVNEDDLSLKAMSSKLNMKETDIEEALRALEAKGLLVLSR